MKRSLIISLILLFSHQYLVSQDLTGTWDGYMAGEKITVCIKTQKNELCGFTSDYVLSRPSSYCKANFRGWWDDDEQVWVLMGTSFIDNSGDHILMILRLWHQKGDPTNMLRGTEEAKYGRRSIFNMGSGRSPLRLTKTSSSLPDDMPDCFPKPDATRNKPVVPAPPKEVTVKPFPKKDSPVVIIAPPVKKPVPATTRKPVILPKPVKAKPVAPKPTVLKPVLPPVIKADTVKKTIKPIPLPPVSIDQPELLKKMRERKKTEFSHLVVNDRNITLNLYDNGVVDNDSVSIFYNGKLIAGKKRLSEKPITIKLELDENASLHEIVMFAENLGSIPPNTALIVVTAGDKRYELHSSASLTENAVLTFEYKPK